MSPAPANPSPACATSIRYDNLDRLLEEVPAVTITDLDDAKLRTLRLALNRLAEDSRWDRDEIALEFSDILAIDSAIDLEISGFEMGEIDTLLKGNDEEDDCLDPDCSSPCVSKKGDLWLLDDHRLFCGDAAELHRQFRLVIGSQWYQALFPFLRWAKETGLELVTIQGGSRYATSIGGTLTGRGADLIIIDDPLNANEALSESARKRVIEWYTGSLVSRLNDKERGTIIAIMQRLHEDDLAGHVLRQGGWVHLNLPAIACEDEIVPLGAGKVHRRQPGDPLHPERESIETLLKIKEEVGGLLFSAQYLQQAIPVEGNLIHRSWFRTYEELPSPDCSTRIVQSWDVALMTGQGNDYSVCTTWHIRKGDVFLAHVYRGRLAYPDLRRKVIALAAERGAATVLIENVGPGMSLLQDLWSDMPPWMTRPSESSRKAVRRTGSSRNLQRLRPAMFTCPRMPPGSLIF